jgi:hypothetical protein
VSATVSLCVSLALLSQRATRAAVEPRRFSFSGEPCMACTIDQVSQA